MRLLIAEDEKSLSRALAARYSGADKTPDFLTNNLITLSRMEEERTRLQMIDFPFSDVVEETVQSFQALARTQNKTFETSIQPMISLYGDEKSLIQLVSILLDNAMKYSTRKARFSFVLKKQETT